MKRRLLTATLCLLLSLVLGVPLVSLVVRSAHGAELLDMNGAKIVVMTGEEFLKVMAEKDAEIAALRAERKKDCGLI